MLWPMSENVMKVQQEALSVIFTYITENCIKSLHFRIFVWNISLILFPPVIYLGQFPHKVFCRR